MSQPTHPALRAAFLAGAFTCALLAFGFYTQHPAALEAWPWRDGRMSNVFVASILAAVAAPLAWTAWSGRIAGTAGGFIHLALMFAGIASVLLPLAASQGLPRIRLFGFGAVAAAVGSAALGLWAQRLAPRDTRPLPLGMRLWFVVFLLILAPGGLSLLAGRPVFPWPLKPETSQVYGWVFLSAMCSFVYPLLRGRMEYAHIGLWGFVAYDAVLIPPFMAMLDTVEPRFQGSLHLYLAILALTAAVSVWYLLVARATSIRRTASTVGAAQAQLA